jgi:flagellin
MPQIINTNIASLNAQRNLNASQRDQESALQRLSSGLRINSAKDDAAGLAISTRFDSQIRGTSVAVRNAGDAISLAQTAEGALDSINTSLRRVRELALQSANDTNTTLDRQALQEEVDQLLSEIESVSKNANFNGKKLLDGSFNNAVFQTGANVGNTISVSVAKVDTSSLGVAEQAGISSRVSTTAITTTASDDDLVAGDLVINGISVDASVGSDDTASVNHASSSSIAKAAAVNRISDLTGVVAVVEANVLAGTTTATAAVANRTITINEVSISLSKATLLSVEENLSLTVSQINLFSAQTGVVASTDGTVAGGIVLTAADGRNISLGGTAANSVATYGIAATGTSTAAASLQNTYVGNFTLVSKTGEDIVLSTDTGNIDNAGFQVGTFDGTRAGVVGENVTISADLASGDLVLNGVTVGPSQDAFDTASSANKSESAIAKAAAINLVSEQSGVTAVVNDNRINSGNMALASSYSVGINGVTIAISLSSSADSLSDQITKTMAAINAKTGVTGVRAEALDSDSITLVADDGRNITITNNSTELGILTTTFGSSITLVSGKEIEISSTTGRTARAGFTIGAYGNAEAGSSIKDIDITSVAGAEKAVLAIDNAINSVASARAELGAVQNRFQNTISNLEVTGENLSAANSRIRDADFAAETAELSRSQVLQQAGISVLAQANARPQQVLSLLQ